MGGELGVFPSPRVFIKGEIRALGIKSRSICIGAELGIFLNPTDISPNVTSWIYAPCEAKDMKHVENYYCSRILKQWNKFWKNQHPNKLLGRYQEIAMYLVNIQQTVQKRRSYTYY